MGSPRYCLITPCRDEAALARSTLDSVVAQSVRPALWLIVDDGSSDDTPRILADYASRHDWIRVLRREGGRTRNAGPRDLDAFYAGWDAIGPSSFDYVCKLDLDLDLPHRYFELLLERMEANARIGTCSGKPYVVGPKGRPVSEGRGDENSVPMAKFYRTSCLQQLNGFVRELGWDSIDGHRCRMHGWIATSWDDESLRFIHLRPTGARQGLWTSRVRHGYGHYFMGTAPLYLLASAAFQLTRPPRIAGSAGMLWGYLKGLALRRPRYDEPGFRRFLRRYHRHVLLFGKQRATEALNRRQASTWRPPRAIVGADPALAGGA